MTAISNLAHIVYCQSCMLLDRTNYASWREVQDAYDDYKASLGPRSEEEIIEYLEIDWGADEARWPFSRLAIHLFFKSSDRVLVRRDESP